MHINFNSLNLSCCGGNRFIFELSNRLVERGHKVTITHAGLKSYYGWFKPRKAEIINCEVDFDTRFLNRIGIRKVDMLKEQQKKLLKHAPKCDVNVATHCLTAKPTYESGKGRLFYLVQHYEPLFYPDNEKLRKEALNSYLLPMHHLCVSKWLTAKVNGLFIGNGVNLSKFKPNGTAKMFDALLCIRDGPKFKNQRLTTEVGRKLLKENMSILVMNGYFTETELVNAYNKCRLLVYLSDIEGFGYHPMESMASGTPVIVSNCTEYITPQLNNGFILPSKFDADTVVSAVKYLLGNSSMYSLFRRRGLETAKKFDFKKVVDRFENCISCA